MRVSRNPYAPVDGERDLRLKTAMHDHVRAKPAYLKRMDAAGYDAVPLMHYSGVASLQHPWRERRWPPEQYLPQELFAELRHIKVFYPNAEEIGFDHVTSPFLTTYIAVWEEGHYARREPWHYGSTQEAIDLIRAFGGLAFVAHPWEPPEVYTTLKRFDGMELYNAYCRQKFLDGTSSSDCNTVLLRNWDHVLRRRPEVVGIAVNDWYGPWIDPNPKVAPETRDSGKVLVLAKAATLAGLRAGITAGAVLAVKDLGARKDRYPDVRAIRVDARAITIALDPRRGGEVHWIANGEHLDEEGPVLPLTALDPEHRYVRAEIVGRDGSTVYTQAFALQQRPPAAPGRSDAKR